MADSDGPGRGNWLWREGSVRVEEGADRPNSVLRLVEEEQMPRPLHHVQPGVGQARGQQAGVA